MGLEQSVFLFPCDQKKYKNAKISIPAANKKAARFIWAALKNHVKNVYGNWIGKGFPPSIEIVAILSQAPLP